jgi:hypothetical protein
VFNAPSQQTGRTFFIYFPTSYWVFSACWPANYADQINPIRSCENAQSIHNLPRDGPQAATALFQFGSHHQRAEMHTKPRPLHPAREFIAAIELRFLLTHHSVNSFESALQKAIPFLNCRNRSDSQSRVDALFLRLISCRSSFNEQGV